MTNKSTFVKSAVITIILSIIASVIYDVLKSEPVFSSVLVGFSFLFKSLITFLSFKIPIWSFLVALLGFSSIILVWKYFSLEKIPTPPDFVKEYTEDEFHNWLWKWDWAWDFESHTWQINNLTPYCSDCEVRLVDRSNPLSNMAECPNCRSRYSSNRGNFETYDSITNLILGKIEKEEFKTSRAT